MRKEFLIVMLSALLLSSLGPAVALPLGSSVLPVITPWEEFRDEGLQAEKEGRFLDAENAFAKSLAEAEKSGVEDERLAISLQLLGGSLTSQYKLERAEPLLRRAVFVSERVNGKNSPALGEALHNLGLVYKEQRRFSDAENALKRALPLLKGAPEPNTMSVLKCVNELALTYKLQKKFVEAEPLYKFSLTTIEKMPSSKKEHIAVALSLLAEVYMLEGKFKLAEPLYLRIMAINAELKTQTRYVDLEYLAEIYRQQGQWAKAEALYKRILPVKSKLFTPDQAPLAQTLKNYAYVLRKLNRVPAALKLERQIGKPNYTPIAPPSL